MCRGYHQSYMNFETDTDICVQKYREKEKPRNNNNKNRNIYMRFRVVGELYIARLNMLKTHAGRKKPEGINIRD